MKLTDKDLETIVKRRKLEVRTALIFQQLKELVNGEFSRFGSINCQNKKIPKLSGSGRRPYAQYPKGLDGFDLSSL